MAKRTKARWLRWGVGAAFFLSGLSSLVLENLWVRMLTLVFGGTTLAIVTVLAAFMSGLALGSALAARFADRVRRPVFVYGLLEAGIALYALLIPSLIGLLPSLYRLFPEDISAGGMAFVRFGLCFLILLVPTTCMGATLPILSRFFVRSQETVGADVGTIYSINTFGAVAGAFSGGFILMPLLGVPWTLYSVSGALMLLASTMMVVGWLKPLSFGAEGSLDEKGEASAEKSIGESSEERDEAEEEAAWMEEIREERRIHYDDAMMVRLQKVVLGVLAVTGGAAMIAQVLWSRALAMVIGSSTYAFTLILVVFLVGLAGGAAWGAWLSRRALDIVGIWSQLLVATALTVGLGVLFMDQLPVIFVALVIDIAHKINPVVLFSLKAGVAAIPILIPTFLMGTFFALGLALFSRGQQRIGWSVGYLYFFNTVGSIIGSVAAGFVIIPLFGLQGGLALCVALYLLCAFALVVAVAHELRLIVGLFTALCGAGVFFVPPWHTGKMGLGMFRLSRLRNMEYRTAIMPGNVLFYREGISATVSVEGDEKHRALKVNGKTDASNLGDRSTQISVSALPLVAHGNAKDVAVIGWGSGMSVGAVLQFPVRSVVAVELEPAVVEASRFFEPWNFFPLRDKRLKLLYNDGRNFLATTQRRFDVIVSEPSNPWMSGVANLFTREYFEIARDRLNDGGILCQWIQLYEMSYDNIISILRTVSEIFPHVQLYEVETDSYDTLLLASMKPFPMPLANFRKLMKQKHYKDLFEKMKFYTPHDLLPRFLIGRHEIAKLLKTSPIQINTDGHNRLEFTAPLDLVKSASVEVFSRFHKEVDKADRSFARYLPPEEVGQTPRKQLELWLETTLSLMRYGAFQRAEEAFKKAEALKQHDLNRFKQIARLLRLMRHKEKAPDLPDDLPTTRPAHRRVWLKNMKALFLGVKDYMKDRHNDCVVKLLPLADDLRFVDTYPETLFYLGTCYRYADAYNDAMNIFYRYIETTEARERRRLAWQRRYPSTTRPALPPTTQPHPPIAPTPTETPQKQGAATSQPTPTLKKPDAAASQPTPLLKKTDTSTSQPTPPMQRR